MKTNIKDIVIGAFAVIGFYVVLTGFKSSEEQQAIMTATPESHQWEMHSISDGNGYRIFSINKVTGEVRRHESSYDYKKDANFAEYVVAEEYVREDK